MKFCKLRPAKRFQGSQLAAQADTFFGPRVASRLFPAWRGRREGGNWTALEVSEVRPYHGCDVVYCKFSGLLTHPLSNIEYKGCISKESHNSLGTVRAFDRLEFLMERPEVNCCGKFGTGFLGGGLGFCWSLKSSH